MVDPDRPRQSARPAPSESGPESEVVDLRAQAELPAELLAEETVRTVLESAADVIFSDGVSAEFLDQWTFETVQLLESRARAASEAAERAGAKRARSRVSASH